MKGNGQLPLWIKCWHTPRPVVPPPATGDSHSVSCSRMHMPMPIHSSRGPFQNGGVYPSCSSHLATTINALLSSLQIYGFDSMILSTHDSFPISQFLRLRVKLSSVSPLTVDPIPIGLYAEVFPSSGLRYHVSWWSLRASIIFLSELIVRTDLSFPWIMILLPGR